VERKRRLLKAKLIKLKTEGSGSGGAAVVSHEEEAAANQAEFKKQKKTKEFR
jgi:hypothetical protein